MALEDQANSESRLVPKELIFIAFFFVWIPAFIFPPAHKLLRDGRVYFISLVATILILGLSVSSYADNLLVRENRDSGPTQLSTRIDTFRAGKERL